MAASYTSCSLDLEHQGWSEGLLAAGFDPTVPAVWLAEGLVMYLSEEGVLNLLREAGSISAKGSRLLVMVSPHPFLRASYLCLCPPACLRHASYTRPFSSTGCHIFRACVRPWTAAA